MRAIGFLQTPVVGCQKERVRTWAYFGTTRYKPFYCAINTKGNLRNLYAGFYDK